MQYLTVQEAADRLRVTTRTVYHWIDSGTLTAYKAEGRVLIRDDDLGALVKPYPGKKGAKKAHVTRRGGKGKTGAKKSSGKGKTEDPNADSSWVYD